ncbi:hypothetical protein NM208_g9400 [Fusarium decemcellulare]|uniref:Uncharacterized protein n=1 Tax=Fusarium decemcellulare TaxID=57161 RepID=A0ACC1S1P5_9HYPO|nr:hypothetical protein NM208_g9400 [Fusarium decemcellulare]
MIEHLKPQQRFFLAQTCTVLRSLAWCNVKRELVVLPNAEKFEAWEAIAYHSPNHWACATCLRLHAVDTSDTPQNRQFECGCSLAGILGRKKDKRRAKYDFQDHHVQLALKFDRLGNVHGEYLRRLLAPHISQAGDHQHLTRTRYMRPKIVNQRLILHSEEVHESTKYPAVTKKITRICPHRGFGPVDDVPTGLDTRLEMAFESPEEEIRDSCPNCPTDYSFQVTGKRQVIVRVWHDFGSHVSHLSLLGRTDRALWDDPVDYWRNLGVRRPPRLLMHYAGASLDEGKGRRRPPLEHEPGSIRELYLTGDQQGGRTHDDILEDQE